MIFSGEVPGQPDFESVSSGDQELTATFLLLRQPICIDGNGDPEQAPISSTQVLQLACSPEEHPELARRGDLIRLEGELFPAHTGYHWTEALLQCE